MVVGASYNVPSGSFLGLGVSLFALLVDFSKAWVLEEIHYLSVHHPSNHHLWMAVGSRDEGDRAMRGGRENSVGAPPSHDCLSLGWL